MCCDEATCSARGEDVGLPIVRDMHHLTTSVNHCVSGCRSGRSYEETSMTSSHGDQLFRLQEKSVRQCARRCGSHIRVAQASPLFSDHAPREVHLWQ
jgi:hypothetical protein